MNATEYETLQDLTPISYFPYEPGLIEWGALILFIGLVSALCFFLTRRPRTKLTNSINFCLSELADIETALNSHEISNERIPPYLTKATLLVKRLISNTHDANIIALAPNELIEYKQSLKSDSLRTLIETISAVDKIRFKPEIDRDSSSQLMYQLKNSLLDYKEALLYK